MLDQYSTDLKHRPPEVPVAIDDIKTDPAFPMVRLEYLVVELDDIDSGWVLTLPNRRIPLLLFGLSGIILQPSETQEAFSTADDFDQLFDDIEGQTRLLIESSDVWMPRELIADAWGEASAGDIFRVQFDLFALCFRFRQDRLDQAEFLERARRFFGALRYSAEETAAYAKWQERQVRTAVENYAIQRQAEQALDWIDSQGNIHPG